MSNKQITEKELDELLDLLKKDEELLGNMNSAKEIRSPCIYPKAIRTSESIHNYEIWKDSIMYNPIVLTAIKSRLKNDYRIDNVNLEANKLGYLLEKIRSAKDDLNVIDFDLIGGKAFYYRGNLQLNITEILETVFKLIEQYLGLNIKSHKTLGPIDPPRIVLAQREPAWALKINLKNNGRLILIFPHFLSLAFDERFNTLFGNNIKK